MYKKYIYLCLALLASVAGKSQTSSDTTDLVTPEKQTLELVKQLWLPTGNAAGLGVNPVADHGDAWLGVFHSSGDYHRAQEGSRVNGLNFLAERYSKIARNLYVWGSFKFSMDRESERAWSDMLVKEYTGPYNYGSEIKGSYDRQLFDLNVKLATGTIGGFTFGVGVDYSVGDLSRLRDPRSRVLMADYAIAPSITYRVSEKQVLGLDAYYRFRKERLDNITTVQKEKEFTYYLFTGMENYWTTTALGKVDRRKTGNIVGADLQYKVEGERDAWLISLGYERLMEDVVDWGRREPGDYNAQKFSFYSGYRRGNTSSLQTLNLRANYTRGQAEEFVQEQVNTTNSNGMVSEKWVTLYNYVTFKDNYLDLSIDYTLYKGEVARGDYRWLAGVKGAFERWEHRYILPESTRDISTLRLGVNGAGRLINKASGKLWLQATVNGLLPVEDNMQLAGENVFTEQVMRPDQEFYKTKALETKIDLQYSFPVQLKKAAMTAYVKGYAGNVYSDGCGSRFSGGISIGILTK